MIARYNNTSLMAGVPGIILQIIGNVSLMRTQSQEMIGLLLGLAGTGLLLFGLAYYAMAKGRNPAWCLLAFLSLLGIIILACLSDLAPDGQER